MNIKQLKEKRAALIKEIDGATEERFAAIQKEIAKINFQITALETDERDAANDEQNAANRAAQRPATGGANQNGGTNDAAFRMAFGMGQTTDPAAADTPETRAAAHIGQMTKREKVALIIGRNARNKNFTDLERRALGTALTTTSATYVQATESLNGVNNAGIFIPTKQLLDFLKEESLLSPIVADIAMTHIAGLTTFPYRKSRDKANAKAEGAKGKDNQMEWATIEGVKGYLQTIIVVTDEILALTDFDFGSYIMDQIMQDINEDWGGELVYGSGTSEHVKGITVAATQKTYTLSATVTITDAIIEGIKLCTGKFRRGAKVYVAQDVHDDITFQKDKNGNFMYPIFNNSTGITSIGVIRTEVDETLNSGDFLIGNVKKYYKVNGLIPMRIETDRTPRNGKTEFVASAFTATAAVPDAFLYYSKKTTG